MRDPAAQLVGPPRGLAGRGGQLQPPSPNASRLATCIFGRESIQIHRADGRLAPIVPGRAQRSIDALSARGSEVLTLCAASNSAQPGSRLKTRHHEHALSKHCLAPRLSFARDDLARGRAPRCGARAPQRGCACCAAAAAAITVANATAAAARLCWLCRQVRAAQRAQSPATRTLMPLAYAPTLGQRPGGVHSKPKCWVREILGGRAWRARAGAMKRRRAYSAHYHFPPFSAGESAPFGSLAHISGVSSWAVGTANRSRCRIKSVRRTPNP